MLSKYGYRNISDLQNPDCSFHQQSSANALYTVHLVSIQYSSAQFPYVEFFNQLWKIMSFWLCKCKAHFKDKSRKLCYVKQCYA